MSVEELSKNIPTQLSGEGKKVLRRFRVLYILFRACIYLLVWGSLAGGISSLENKRNLLIALGVLVFCFIIARLGSHMVFEAPKEKLSVFVIRIMVFLGFGVGFYRAGQGLDPLTSEITIAICLGVVLSGLGMFLWWQARQKLSPFYFDVIYTIPPQTVCAEGLYEKLRHPGYVGEYLSLFGVAIILNSFWGGVVAMSLTLMAFGYRIYREEKLLQRDLLGYSTYCEKVKRFGWF